MNIQTHLQCVFILILCGLSQGAEVHVSPSGNDTNPGTRQQPLKTFAAAQRIVRAHPLRGREAITVWFAPGTYYLSDPIVLTSEDSGTQAAPIVYASAGGGAIGGRDAAVISGGDTLTGLVWTSHHENILKTSIPPGTRSDQLFINGTRQIMARYPNFNPAERIFNGYAADAISPSRASRWADPVGGFIKAMHRNEWGDYTYRITGKDENGSLQFEGGWQNNRQMGMHNQYRMVEGIFEELDAPGEWFLNEKTNTLYFYPPIGMAAADVQNATVEIVRLRELITFKGTEAAPVRFVTLKGFTIRHAARTFMDNKEPLNRSDWTVYRGGSILFDGAEDCGIDDCLIDQVGANAVFVNMYNRRITIRGSHIANAGANGIAFVGDPKAVRNPLFEYNQRHDYTKLDKTPGPQTNNYPADCLVEECLIYLTGRSEKQTAPVQISMAQSITVRHCSIYDVPRAGINISEGTWGGHIIEFCDVFDTVKETGDHGSFNSWGRDRFWDRDISLVNQEVAKDPSLPLLDVVKPIILRNNRWRCDHGWDIDLDDGSSNYQIYNNLMLNGGLKFREGYQRVAENNVMVRNTFHPHVWFAESGDRFVRNIVGSAYRPIQMPRVWGKEIDHNLLPTAQALEASKAAGRDANSAVGDPMFVDPANGDFTLKMGSPALALGFKNFPMDQFGVTKPSLKAIARTPSFAPPPSSPARGGRRGGRGGPATASAPVDDRIVEWMGARVKSITTLGEQSAAGLPDIAGVMLLEVPQGSPAERAGLRRTDVILECNGEPVRTFADLERSLPPTPPTAIIRLGVMRNQQMLSIQVTTPATIGR